MTSFPTLPIGHPPMPWTKIGLGTWNMEPIRKDSINALRAGIQEGANHVDTAEMYGAGEVEDIVGEALKGLREKVFLTSKVLPKNASFKRTLNACHQSLKRLKTDSLDLYLLHWRESDVRLEETFKAFEQLRQNGKIKQWGVSNFSVKDMKEAKKIAGPHIIACNQVLYYVRQRAIEKDLLPWQKENQVPLVAYSPLGQGKIKPNKVISQIAEAKNATPAQIHLAYLIHDPLVVAIPKSSDVRRTIENVQAMNIQLTAEDVSAISNEYPVKAEKELPMI